MAKLILCRHGETEENRVKEMADLDGPVAKPEPMW